MCFISVLSMRPLEFCAKTTLLLGCNGGSRARGAAVPCRKRFVLEYRHNGIVCGVVTLSVDYYYIYPVSFNKTKKAERATKLRMSSRPSVVVFLWWLCTTTTPACCYTAAPPWWYKWPKRYFWCRLVASWLRREDMPRAVVVEARCVPPHAHCTL